MMTHQEIFDTVYTFLSKQGKQSLLGESGRCAYRGDSGAKCAVGCLIKDEHYSTKIEGMGVNPYILEGYTSTKELEIIRALELSGVEPDNAPYALLSSLQHAHDEHHIRGLPVWKNEMKDLAVVFGLEFNHA